MVESAAERQARWLTVARAELQRDGYPEQPANPSSSTDSSMPKSSGIGRSILLLSAIGNAVLCLFCFGLWKLDNDSWNSKAAICELASRYGQKPPNNCAFYEVASSAAGIALFGMVLFGLVALGLLIAVFFRAEEQA